MLRFIFVFVTVALLSSTCELIPRREHSFALISTLFNSIFLRHTNENRWEIFNKSRLQSVFFYCRKMCRLFGNFIHFCQTLQILRVFSLRTPSLILSHCSLITRLQSSFPLFSFFIHRTAAVVLLCAVKFTPSLLLFSTYNFYRRIVDGNTKPRIRMRNRPSDEFRGFNGWKILKFYPNCTNTLL